jgi:hypothetical protein
MASFIWDREPEEAYSNPYEYEAQEQFVREAKRILGRLCKSLGKYNLHFYSKETSVQKATWMLHNDAIDALREALSLLEKKKHKLVGRIFRDAWESSQLVEYFLSGTPRSQSDLKKWFENEIIGHEKIRERLKKAGRNAEAEQRRQRHRELSKFTHRSYKSLLKGYSLGADDKMVYDSYEKWSVLPHTVSAYYAILGDLIIQNLESMKNSKLISAKEIEMIWKQNLEKKSVPRKFACCP